MLNLFKKLFNKKEKEADLYKDWCTNCYGINREDCEYFDASSISSCYAHGIVIRKGGSISVRKDTNPKLRDHVIKENQELHDMLKNAIISTRKK